MTERRTEQPVIDESAAKRICTVLGWEPKREWVGLTEEEIKECFKITPDQFLPWQIYRKIEAKLKEKNS